MYDSQTIAARIPPGGEGGVQTGKLGLIAGNGRFPFLLLDAARAHGLSVVVAAIKEETDPEIDARAAARPPPPRPLKCPRASSPPHQNLPGGRRHPSRNGRPGQAHPDLLLHSP